MLDQQAELDRLNWLLADTRRLVSAVSAVEGNAAAKAKLKVCTMPCIEHFPQPSRDCSLRLSPHSLHSA